MYATACTAGCEDPIGETLRDFSSGSETHCVSEKEAAYIKHADALFYVCHSPRGGL